MNPLPSSCLYLLQQYAVFILWTSVSLGLIINYLRQGFIVEAGLKLCAGEDGLDLLILKSSGVADTCNHPWFQTQSLMRSRTLTEPGLIFDLLQLIYISIKPLC